VPKIAILSDIHANLSALTAVLEEVRATGITEICFGGDTVGYAAKPDECVNLVRHHGGNSVMGNHDYYTTAVLDHPENIPTGNSWTDNPVWAGVIHAARSLSADNARWLAHLPGFLKIPGAIVGHAALHDLDDWPYLQSLTDAGPTLRELAHGGDHVGFFGHTHIQTHFSDPSAAIQPEQMDSSRIHLPEGAVCAILVGSVGQPRDADPRAAWAIWDSDKRVVEFRRTEYPAWETAHQIIEAGLPESSALRLLDHVGVRRFRELINPSA
jgi:diadenosine tetraphosphatase ApaH/serine/threonine PP2A family protein phosphatase